MEELALFVSVLVLLAVKDLGVVWRRLQVIGVAAVVVVVLLITGTLLESYVLPLTTKYRLIPDGMVLPFLASLFVLVYGYMVFDYVKRRRRKRPERSGDPGDYKMGWG